MKSTPSSCISNSFPIPPHHHLAPTLSQTWFSVACMCTDMELSTGAWGLSETATLKKTYFPLPRSHQLQELLS